MRRLRGRGFLRGLGCVRRGLAWRAVRQDPRWKIYDKLWWCALTTMGCGLLFYNFRMGGDSPGTARTGFTESGSSAELDCESNMEYTTILTAAGHRLMVNPRTQKVMYRDILDAILAESRVGKRVLSYNRYRAKRGCSEDCNDAVSITSPAKTQLESFDDQTFQRIDAGILRLLQKPTAASTKPKYYRWFIGDLRRVLVDEFPILYSFDEERGRLTILFFGFPRWKRAPHLAQQDGKPKK